jgi:hypothetical protein
MKEDYGDFMEDSEYAPCLMVVSEGMINVAKALQVLFINALLFRKTVKQNLGFIRDRYE